MWMKHLLLVVLLAGCGRVEVTSANLAGTYQAIDRAMDAWEAAND